jgi:hypothetical protein
MAEAEDQLKNAEDAAKHRQLLTSLFPHSPYAIEKTAQREIKTETAPTTPRDTAPATEPAATTPKQQQRFDEPPLTEPFKHAAPPSGKTK